MKQGSTQGYILHEEDSKVHDLLLENSHLSCKNNQDALWLQNNGYHRIMRRYQ